ncbi:hypothetical protein D3C72_2236730 [compost metagenome]
MNLGFPGNDRGGRDEAIGLGAGILDGEKAAADGRIGQRGAGKGQRNVDVAEMDDAIVGKGGGDDENGSRKGGAKQADHDDSSGN